jgi:flagellar hook assembly protein FlgD
VLPSVTTLSRAMPTPFREATTFELALAQPGGVTLAIYGVDGRRIRTLVAGERAAGVYRVSWDGRDDDGRALAAGIYFARLTARELSVTRTVVRVQ